ncbi:MAG: response regulator, partial [Muribaculaceae bacterium]|nr:response regulator [Muribaculaceae bacterium]
IYVVPTVAADRYVLGIAEDQAHAMWASIGGSLVRIAVSGGNGDDGPLAFSTHTYDSSDGLQPCDFNQRSISSMADGRMMIGGYYGVNSWRPDAIRTEGPAPKVFFTGLSLFNEDVAVGSSRGGRVLLPQRLSDMSAIELGHSDNEFTISFATDCYVNPAKTTYLYRLDGFNEEWQQLPPNTHHVTYTNLPPGHYKLHVRAVSGDGTPGSNDATLDITVRPPFYATTLAKALYVVLGVLFVLACLWLLHRRDLRVSRKRMEQEARRKQEELDQMKFRFFTNVSHELRTPLTLITAPLDSLLKQPLDERIHDKLEIIHNNADKLLSMVNQLLDFRKNEMAGHSLNLSRGNIVAFVHSACDNFRSLSEKKGIHLTFFSPLSELVMEFDEDKMGKIISNLLSNAFKFTPEDGRVDVAVAPSPGGDMLEISVADSGCGISDADKQRVFERFFQAADGPAVGGTGIGLSLVAEFTRLHGGTVGVGDIECRAPLFSVCLEIVEAFTKTTSEPQTFTSGEEDAILPDTDTQPRLGLLVVDDNPDLQQFLKSELSDEYDVTGASDGVDALNKVKRRKPDIIISDLMMEGMDGVELCRRLKSDPLTTDIPLLILTAKHDVSDKIEGLTLGADDYVTKPFNLDVLRLRLRKLLDLRGQGARRALIDPEPRSIAITSLDERLIERAVHYVDDNMKRTDLSVEELATELGMSRVHLYKRLKQITGKTPIEFIRVLRLKRAAQMLRESQLNISEIAYNCGFNNPKYFSRYFKEEFGVLPSVYQDLTNPPHTGNISDTAKTQQHK